MKIPIEIVGPREGAYRKTGPEPVRDWRARRPHAVRPEPLLPVQEMTRKAPDLDAETEWIGRAGRARRAMQAARGLREVENEAAERSAPAGGLSGRDGEARADRSPPGDGGGREEAGTDWKDRYLRLRADFENHKRNTASERERLAGMGKERVLDDLFPLVENMERAVQAACGTDGGNGILEGVEMVYRELLGVLEKHGVDRIEAEGQAFDPGFHEAVGVVRESGEPENTVVKELRPGFVRDGKVLRHASVLVAAA